MSDGGPVTGTESQGSTQEASTEAQAGARFTDDDMAAARKSWEAKAAKDADRASKKAISSLLGELGFSDADELRETLTGKQAQATEAEKTVADVNKLRRRLGATESERDQYAKQLADLKGRLSKQAVKDAIGSAAQKVDGIGDLVFAAVNAGLAKGQVMVDEDGSVFVADQSGEPLHGMTVERLVKELVSERPELQRGSPGMGGGSHAPLTNGAGKPDLTTREGQMAAAMAQLRAKGLA